MEMKCAELERNRPVDTDVWQLYLESFPAHEIRSAASHAEAMRDAAFHPMIVRDENGTLLALLFYWQYDDSIYIEHLAVNPALRGRQIGTTLLNAFILQHDGRQVLLEIDPPEDEVSVKRLRFYAHIGFVENNYAFTHPSYRRGPGATPHRLVILSYGKELTPEAFARFEAYLRGHVMQYTDD